MIETPASAPLVEAQEPVTAEQAAEQPLELSEPIQSTGPVEQVIVPEQVDPPACESLPAVVTEVGPALPAPSEPADAGETRRKGLGAMLRNWLGSVA